MSVINFYVWGAKTLRMNVSGLYVQCEMYKQNMSNLVVVYFDINPKVIVIKRKKCRLG